MHDTEKRGINRSALKQVLRLAYRCHTDGHSGLQILREKRAARSEKRPTLNVPIDASLTPVNLSAYATDVPPNPCHTLFVIKISVRGSTFMLLTLCSPLNLYGNATSGYQ